MLCVNRISEIFNSLKILKISNSFEKLGISDKTIQEVSKSIFSRSGSGSESQGLGGLKESIALSKTSSSIC